jgi:hypothetical protein
MTKANGHAAVKEAEVIPAEFHPEPAPAPAEEKLPALTTDHKFNIRDLQLKHQTSQLQYAQAQANAKTAEQNFRNYIGQMAEELKIDTTKLQLNLDTLEFESRVAQPAAPAA